MNSSTSPDPSASALDDASIAHALDTLAGDDPEIGVAVSGGSDSLALLRHAHRWARARNRTLRAATVDHGLRSEAPAEAAHVARICADLDVPHETLTWRPPSNTVRQAAARRARYDLLASWAARHALSAVAIGHTRDDRLETFLIRARAGSSWYGLAGPMPAAASPSPAHDSLRLIRPLLTATRTQLRTGLNAAGIDWIEDPSNTSRRHERIRMRALLKAAPDTTHASIIATMNRLAQLRAATLAAARETFETHIEFNEAEFRLPTAAFCALPAQSQLRLLEALTLALIPRPAPPRSDRLARLSENLANPDAASHNGTLAGCMFRKSPSVIAIAHAPPRLSAPPPQKSLANPAARARLLLMEPHARLLRNCT